MSDHEDIRALLAAYCQRCDDGKFDEFAELFEEQAEFIVMGETRVGRQAISTWMAEVLPPPVRGKHIISEPAIELIIDLHGTDGDVLPEAATCRTDYLFVGRDKDGNLGVTSSGRYLDRLVRSTDDGRWRFASRQIVFLGEEPPE
jgi:uncharacterized protein (TIGR02246 family)